MLEEASENKETPQRDEREMPEIPKRAAYPSADEEWQRLTGDLAVCLTDLAEDDYLILSYKRAGYYVQFAAQGKFGMRVEASSNTYIVPAEACLSIDDYLVMARLGWKPPAHLIQTVGRQILDLTGDQPRILTEVSNDSKDREGSPNFYMDLPSPVDVGFLAELTVRTFHEVYGVHHPGELQYKAFTSGGPQLRFPTLRLKRDHT